MFLAYQGDLCVQYGKDILDLHNRCMFMKIDRIEEVEENYTLYNGQIVPVKDVPIEEEQTEEQERVSEE